ncbi:MAG: ATPase [Marmoricola sp.]|nr:ATPase [Marmoricola sp.]
MSTPVLHLLAGSNGSGKSTFAEVLIKRTHLPFVNADLIAADLWPGDRDEQSRRAGEVSVLAAGERERLLDERRSFITETVFSHESKVALVRQALARGYVVQLYAMLLPEDLAVERVADRAMAGGHLVPEEKIRSRYQRLWGLIAQARALADRAEFYDNSSLDRPFRRVAVFESGHEIGSPDWPSWTPAALL